MNLVKFWKKYLVFFLIFLAAGLIAYCYFSGPSREKTEPIKVISVTPTPVQKEILKMAVMADIHIDWQNFKKALQIAKKDGVSVVVIVGDLTTVGEKKELLAAKKILDQSNLKYFVVPGNHDLWYSHKIKQDVFGEVFGKDFGTYRLDNLKLILVDNAGYNQAQAIWLKKEIADCPQIYCLVFMHLPLNHPNSSHIMGESDSKIASQSASLVKLLVEDKIRGVFAGHIHYSSEYKIGGLKTTVVGALSANRNPQLPRFLEISIKEGRIVGDFLMKKKEIILEP